MTDLSFEESVNALLDSVKEIVLDEKFSAFSSVGTIEAADIPCDASLRRLCEQNTCGAFGRNYTCPPFIGEVEQLIIKLHSYKQAIVFRRYYALEDSFDVEGMAEGSAQFSRLTQQIFKLSKENPLDTMVLSAGGCKLCERCGMLDDIPCRHPDNTVSSLEGHGINVSGLAKKLDIPYISGQNTVTYFGALFIK